jgi:predicted ribosomally synthesized peptide with SipW-like signal peptide
MKKIILLCLATVLAMGGLGVGYAAWTDEVTISGSVQSGSLCFSIEDNSWGEVNGCPDFNWGTWVWDGISDSCPPGYHFEGVHLDEEGKCPATVSFNPHYDADGNVYQLDVIINNAYPYYLADISFYVCNCGTIPLKIKAPIISQDPSLLIQYGNNIGAQVHPGLCKEISFKVGVTQHLYNDPAEPLTPMNTPLSFTISIEGIQWNEY